MDSADNLCPLNGALFVRLSRAQEKIGIEVILTGRTSMVLLVRFGRSFLQPIDDHTPGRLVRRKVVVRSDMPDPQLSVAAVQM